MFAVLSLPDTDDYLTADKKEQGVELVVEVKTYWRNYDKSLPASKHRRPYTPHWWFEDPMPHLRETNFITPLLVRKTDSIQLALAPVIRSASWFPTDRENGVISVEGTNFYTGTSVSLGGVSYTNPANGLLIKSDHYLQIKAPAAAIGVGEPILIGRYGASIPIRTAPGDQPGAGMSIGEIRLRPIGPESTEVVIPVHVDSPRDRTTLRQRLAYPILTIGSQTVSGQAFETGLGDNDVYIRTVVPQAREKLLGTYLRLVYPMWGPNWTGIASLPNPQAYRVESLTKGGSSVALLISSDQPGFRPGAEIRLDRRYPVDTDVAVEKLPSGMGVRLYVTRKALSNFSKLQLIPGKGEDAVFLSIPDDNEKPKPLPPVLKPATQSFNVGQNDSKAIVLKGTDLNNVKSVQFEGEDLAIRAQAGNKELLVFLTRAVTAKAGSTQLALITSEDKTLLIDLTIHQTNTKEKR
jgi:hypothetical protein